MKTHNRVRPHVFYRHTATHDANCRTTCLPSSKGQTLLLHKSNEKDTTYLCVNGRLHHHPPSLRSQLQVPANLYSGGGGGGKKKKNNKNRLFISQSLYWQINLFCIDERLVHLQLPSFSGMIHCLGVCLEQRACFRWQCCTSLVRKAITLRERD